VLPRALTAAFLREMRLRRRMRRVPHEIALNNLHRKLLLALRRDRTVH
jgi:hypothetical protein